MATAPHGSAVDPDAMLRIVGELCAVLRRRGMPVAPPETMDAARALATLGLDDRATTRAALAATLVKRGSDRETFAEVFDRFFDPARAAPLDLLDRLRAEGFTDDEIDTLRMALNAMVEGPSLGALLGIGGAGELTALLRRTEVVRGLESLTNPLQIGFFTQRTMQQVGLGTARGGMALLRAALRGAMGERGELLADLLEKELERTRKEVRDHVKRELDRRTLGQTDVARARRLELAPFTSLSDKEVEEVRRAVRRLAEKLRGKARVRRRRALRGPVDLRRTMRVAWKTMGVPIAPVRRRRRRDRPRLVVLCDVSDSVRLAARFMLELVYALQELFSGTRSFVFVSELGEVTELFTEDRPALALARVFAGEAVSLADNSNYGRVFVEFHKRHLAAIDRRTTVVVIGDGRNNYQPDEAWVLRDLRRRARALLWINPERKGGWSVGDSAMARYAPECTRVIEVACAAELEEAARALVAM